MDSMDMGSYTQNKYADMLNEAAEGYDYEFDFSALLEKLDSNDFFETFSARLLRYLSKHREQDLLPQDAYLFLFDRMKATGMKPNRNTLKNWLNVSGNPEGNAGPNMGDAGREAMFQVAFSLGLNAKETEDFFHRVYLDKAFNARNVREFVYFYCISHGRTYTEAQTLAAEAEKLLSSGSGSAGLADTVLIRQTGLEADDDAELLSFIAEHTFSFNKKNETALAAQDRLLDELKGTPGRKGLAERECEASHNFEREGSEGRNLHSVDFVLDVAVNGPEEIEKISAVAGFNRARKVFARKEIYNQFPDANAISHPDSSYILRKNIIFLFFYWFWVQDTLKGNPEGDDETFLEEMNNILHRCGFGPLYYGNPYDWLFLYCSNCKSNDSIPLDVFRGIMAGSEDE